jgi:hypothetical protein
MRNNRPSLNQHGRRSDKEFGVAVAVKEIGVPNQPRHKRRDTKSAKPPATTQWEFNNPLCKTAFAEQLTEAPRWDDYSPFHPSSEPLKQSRETSGGPAEAWHQ